MLIDNWVSAMPIRKMSVRRSIFNEGGLEFKPGDAPWCGSSLAS